jgi:hypothetical protein
LYTFYNEYVFVFGADLNSAKNIESGRSVLVNVSDICDHAP